MTHLSSPLFRLPLAAALLGLAAWSPLRAQAPAAPTEPVASKLPMTLPATLEAGRFFLQPQLRDGRKLRLFSDTGGGLLFTHTGARAMGVTPKAQAADAPPQLLAWPQFDPRAWIPPPRDAQRGVPTLAAPPDQERRIGDGMLGAAWFGGRSWEFDYPRGRLRLLPDGALPRVEAAHRVALGLQKGDDGRPTTHFPRIAVRIDGETLQLLFDTGASLMLTEQGVRELGGGPADRAGSFIAASVLQRWRERHPHWRVIEHADRNDSGRLIEVPELEVGGYRVGPVWFAERRDRNFHDYMSKWMDQRVDGAIGGNAFADLKISVDYPSATATFER
ncbi:retropepsin-like domain-containing protein [Lysobacter sp. BMK333-48F3]|uniref:retropepsin-like domain-containing protein n=1 Tax=Lysobacter sp. BMK333-48F3 TaxID=2867962 RepID=UPI001C8B87B4|nr:retropepsin-like domain-containing protein [Lysobacter sp. BMK333-48F3]MBX9402139.1 retropepsin-like domain-containing protein [Lysobacter sp. BMK333-48F3]